VISMKKPCSKKKIRSLESELKQGVPFPELAKKYSDDISTASNGGDLGYIKAGTLNEPYDMIAFSLEDGQVSEIIETDKSYCVFSVGEKKDVDITPFDEVKDRIEAQLLNEAAKPLVLADAKRFKIEAKKTGFEKAATRKALTVFETDYFRSSDRVPTIGKSPLFMNAAMGLGTNEVSNEMSYDEGYAVMEIADVKPRENLPFSEVSGTIEKKILSENSSAYAENAARHALDLISEGVPLKELENRMSVHITTLETSSTCESPSNIGDIIRKGDGFYVTILVGKDPSIIPNCDQIFDEVAGVAVLDKAEKLAREQAEELLRSGAVTGEMAVKTPPFSRNDYVIEREYMKPFIEQCFSLNAGQAGIVKSLGKYYVVQVGERGIQISGYKDESAVIRSQVLKKKRDEYADDWLKKEREKAQVQMNL
ncbi:MAG: peptidylprolyl isomerase, partial [bacterium]